MMKYAYCNEKNNYFSVFIVNQELYADSTV